MLSCRPCMLRHIEGALQDLGRYRSAGRGNSLLRYPTLRTIASAPSLTDYHGDKIISRSRTRGDEETYDSKNEKDRSVPLNRKEWLQSRGSRPLKKREIKPEEEFAIRKELTFLGDPLKLALHVLSILRKDKFEEAENLVRKASRQIQCTVSWNHLVNWQLSRGRANGAIKTYNEMKKRRQIPDPYTYTTLFNGLAENAHYPQAVSKAMSIYNSMFAENSPVKPNMTHTNAALKVCARAGDMDSLFAMAAKLPQKGPQAADKLTFTTILNFLRQNMSAATVDGASSAHEAMKEKTISNARKIWDDIIDRWSQGDIWIDEDLVCSMGRVLLFGKKKDLDDIFALVEQTMKIPLPIPRLGSRARDKIDPDFQGKTRKPVRKAFSNATTMTTEGVESSSHVPQDEFRVVNPPSPPKGTSAFAKPGCNTLSLVLLALDGLKLKRFVSSYWESFTTDHKVRPDRENYITYLRILRTFRASSETIALLLQMPKTMFENKTFRIAMSACARDKNNQSAFGNAEKILDLMQESQSELDLPALRSYMEVALYGQPYQNEGKGNLHLARGQQIFGALQRLESGYASISEKLSRSERPKGEAAKTQARIYKEEALALAREMIGAYDKLGRFRMVPTETHSSLVTRRNSLEAFVAKHDDTNAAKVVDSTRTSNTTEIRRYKRDVV